MEPITWRWDNGICDMKTVTWSLRYDASDLRQETCYQTWSR